MPRHRRRDQAFDDALDAVSDLLKIAAAVADAVSVPALKPVVAILSEVIQRVKDTRTNSETEAAFFEKTKTLGEVIRKNVDEANAAPEGAARVLKEQINALLSALGKIQETADGLKGGEGFRGWCKAFCFVKRNEAILANMTSQLATAQAMFILDVHLAVQNAVGRVEQTVADAEERRTIDAIPYVSAGYLSVKEIKSGFMLGTRTEIFGDLKSWSGPGYPAVDPRRLFLLTGGAGLGKSAIAHQLCVRLAGQWHLNLGASFFFSRGTIESAHALFSTIARQLAISQRPLRSRITDATKTFLDNGRDQQMRGTFEELLLRPLAGQPGCTIFNQTTFIVIDGLDECKDRDLIPDLLRCLLELVRGIPWLRVFLATRPERHILPILTSQDATDVVYHRRLDDTLARTESKVDVDFYLRQTLQGLHPYGDFVRAHPAALDHLIARADGLFIYARVAVKHLEIYDTRPEEQFALLLSSSGAGLSALDELYLQVLRSAFPQRDLAASPAMHRRLHDFLTFMSLRRAKLPPATTALLLTLTEDDVRWMASCLRAVLLVDEHGDLAPLHATFTEFLVDSRRCIDLLYHVDPPKGHALLAAKCSQALTYDTVTTALNSTLVPLQSYRLYVSSNWHGHLGDAEYSAELKNTLQATIQMQPVLTRLYDAPVDVEINRIALFLGDSEEATALCREHLNFRFYCEVWWMKMAGNYSSRRPPSVAITQLKSRWGFYIGRHHLKDTFCVRTEDISRYTAVLQDLLDKIRDSGTEQLWYNLVLGDRDWEPW
ncbi:hypothetical protein PsYK624_101210 [Phanerochaete sordida]|uniref:NACHT domain-containing protein n=1 Tax=Phanerochaete sordida TaxID=48140 RepID=A0A9P3LG53_9APHY|nr:hypothetical protein PsYK624_101210 [Phanerochaete sordida]